MITVVAVQWLLKNSQNRYIINSPTQSVNIVIGAKINEQKIMKNSLTFTTISTIPEVWLTLKVSVQELNNQVG